MSKLDRRNFLKKTSLTAAALATATAFDSCAEQEQERPTGSQYMGDFAAPKLETVKIALIGVGARGSGHARDFASLEGTEIVAISDLYED
jgi:hypothetical protein